MSKREQLFEEIINSITLPLEKSKVKGLLEEVDTYYQQRMNSNYKQGFSSGLKGVENFGEDD